jgi:hypothetical protein
LNSSRSDLEKYALTSEQYYRHKTNKQVYGGLHDYIDTLTDFGLVNYIVAKAYSFPILANIERLSVLADGYGFKNHTLTILLE